VFVSLISGFVIFGSANENKVCHVPLNKSWLWVQDSVDWSSGKMAAYFIIRKPLASITVQPVQCHSHCIMDATPCTTIHQVVSSTLSSSGILLIHFQMRKTCLCFASGCYSYKGRFHWDESSGIINGSGFFLQDVIMYACIVKGIVIASAIIRLLGGRSMYFWHCSLCYAECIFFCLWRLKNGSPIFTATGSLNPCQVGTRTSLFSDNML
jgi:hypothetical protein